MLPYEKSLIEFACKQGIYDLLVSTYPVLPGERFVQSAFLDMMINRKDICYSRKGRSSMKIGSFQCSECNNEISLYIKGGDRKVNYFIGYCTEEPVISHSYIRQHILNNRIQPLFVFDMSLLNFFGTKNELGEAVLVIAHALQITRRFLYDRNLAVTSINEALTEELKRVVFDHDMIVSDKTSADLLWTSEIEDSVLISPLARKPLAKEDLENTQGIVIPLVFYWDRRMEKYVNNLVPWAKVRHLELHGSVVGVPHRPTRILEIILDVLYNNMDLDIAIIHNMNRKNLFHRVKFEISKMIAEGVDSLDELLTRVSWLVSDNNLVKKVFRDLVSSNSHEKELFYNISSKTRTT
ncbi:MAG: hypothetical protein F7B60_06835 [Desulfurococcales archaeon]|nr:hypothetical protein [Desulfurococcales archaeon]